MAAADPTEPARGRRVGVTSVRLGDGAGPGYGAGFVVRNDPGDPPSVRLAGLRIELAGDSRPPRLALADPTDVTAVGAESGRGDRHPNGIDVLDHIVICGRSADSMRSALAGKGLAVRRERSTEMAGVAVVQLFAPAGATLLECVAPADATIPMEHPFTAMLPDPDSAAVAPLGTDTVVWGLAFSSPDLVATRAWFGERCCPPRPAVQEGREILSLRRSALGISLPVTVLTARHRVS
ncbi:MAG: hypothetical protein R2698_07250 [Microthrixaceae bacterium]